MPANKSDIFLKRFLQDAKLYVLVDAVDYQTDTSATRLIALIDELVDAKVSLIQLRDKKLADSEIVSVGRMISQRTSGTESRFIINDRPDLAVAAEADGVHLGQHDMPIDQAKLIFGRDLKIFGVSTHSIEQARAAAVGGADYIGVGPVFASSTKSFDSHVGMELVRSVVLEIDLPAFAIGGINLTNVEEVMTAGLNRVAVSAAVARAEDSGNAAREFISRLSRV